MPLVTQATSFWTFGQDHGLLKQKMGFVPEIWIWRFTCTSKIKQAIKDIFIFIFIHLHVCRYHNLAATARIQSCVLLSHRATRGATRRPQRDEVLMKGSRTDFCDLFSAVLWARLYFASKLSGKKQEKKDKPHSPIVFWCGSKACLWSWMARASGQPQPFIRHSNECQRSPFIWPWWSLDSEAPVWWMQQLDPRPLQSHLEKWE